MKSKIIAVGKIKEKYLQEGIAEYKKRSRQMEIVEVPDEKTPDRASEKEKLQIKEKEGQRILEKIKSKDFVIALAIEGKQHSSESFAQYLETLAVGGHGQIIFVIGGSLGLSAKVMERANATLSFGKMTFPHQLMRLMLTEQIYRAEMIVKGSPYHK